MSLTNLQYLIKNIEIEMNLSSYQLGKLEEFLSKEKIDPELKLLKYLSHESLEDLKKHLTSLQYKELDRFFFKESYNIIGLREDGLLSTFDRFLDRMSCMENKLDKLEKFLLTLSFSQREATLVKLFFDNERMDKNFCMASSIDEELQKGLVKFVENLGTPLSNLQKKYLTSLEFRKDIMSISSLDEDMKSFLLTDEDHIKFCNEKIEEESLLNCPTIEFLTKFKEELEKLATPEEKV